MAGGEEERQKSIPPKPYKFAVYQNQTIDAALTATSLRPSTTTIFFIVFIFSTSAAALFSSLSRESTFITKFGFGYISHEVASLFTKVIQVTAGLISFGTFLALIKVISQWRMRNVTDVTIISPSKGMKEQTHLTNRQLGLLGLKPKAEPASVESSKKPPKSRVGSPSPSNALVPLHQPFTGPTRSARVGGDKSTAGGGSTIHSFSSPSKSPASPSVYLVSAASSQSPSIPKASPGSDQFVSTPWSNKRSGFHKEIATEEELEKFLADVDEKFSESASKLSTPPPISNGFGMATPNTIASSVNTSGTTRSTPLRPVRMSPGSQKFTTPPKKGDGDLPPPMSMGESVEAFKSLGIYPQIELWEDNLRQWFSLVLLNPLLDKIDTSHINVMQTASKLGVTITISKVGSDTPTASATVSPIERTSDWQPAFALDEDGLLHQLRASLVQALESSLSKVSTTGFQQSPNQSASVPLLQECINAITEHQRILALVKGEWGKGLLPQSSIRADYTVQRIRELAEGTCVKNYEYLISGELHEKMTKKWNLEHPTDSHLLLYLFCAFLEYPKWMLHVDPTAYSGVQSSKNPLFLGVLPPKERFPEKYIAVISGVPSVLHPGACILAVGRQVSPIYALYWDKKLQFSLQGRTALWDSILLLCYKIKASYGGIVRGMHLGSSALNILPLLDTQPKE